MDMLSIIQQYDVPFVQWLGIRFLSAAPERITAEMLVRDDLCNRSAILHGGALMAFADTLAASATHLNLKALGRRPSNRRQISSRQPQPGRR